MAHTTNFSFDKPLLGSRKTTWADDYTTGDPLTDPSPGLAGNWEKMDQLLLAQQNEIVELQNAIDELDVLKQAYRVQVGELYATTDATDPATILGYGTWAVWGAGRAVVGEGGGWTIGEERGSDFVTLTTSQIPSHTHSANPPNTSTSTNGSHTHSYTGTTSQANKRDSSNGSGTGVSSSTGTSGSAGSHSHTFNVPSFTSGSAGSNSAHENRMPSQAAYIWERTA